MKCFRSLTSKIEKTPQQHLCVVFTPNIGDVLEEEDAKVWKLPWQCIPWPKSLPRPERRTLPTVRIIVAETSDENYANSNKVFLVFQFKISNWLFPGKTHSATGSNETVPSAG